jgi:copper(I)-binding protein
MFRMASTSRRPRRWRASAAIAVAAVTVSGLAAGCAVPAEAGPAIQLSSAQIVQPGSGDVTNAYVDVRNSGPADKLVAARISVGGVVVLRAPLRQGLVQMRTVKSIGIPAKSFTGLDPNGSHLLITGAGPMQAGTEITLTLVFAHAGPVSVSAMVTNPETGGSSYFLN